MQSGKPILNSYVAKLLLSMGNRIIDIQPNRNKENAIILYFEDTQKLRCDLQSITNNRHIIDNN